MQDETTIKALVQDVSHMPPDRLCEELVLRSSEMEKIAGLDARIAEELRALDARSSVMQVRRKREYTMTSPRTCCVITRIPLVLCPSRGVCTHVYSLSPTAAASALQYPFILG